jgi:tyrosinase
VARPTRLEVHDFVKNEKYFSLYIQALRIIYAKPSSAVASWFQIGGIHGVNATWNGSPGQQNGYCVHGLQRFSTWHRGYVVLIEQEIQKVALDIAKTYKTDPTGWQNAAKSLRQPYWGWDEYSTFIPPTQVLSDAQVQITVADGSKQSVPNPWLSFTFPPDKQGQFGVRTTRNPNLRTILERTRDTDFLDKVQNVYLATSWSDFSSRLESNPHNTIHNRVGGTMGTFWSSYDPIFWLHHTQVDRVLYKWYNIRKIFSTETTNLNPFWETQSAYWKSLGVREVNNLNYQYAVPLPTIPSKIPPIRLPFPQRFIQASESIDSFVEHKDAEPAATLGEISQRLGVSLPVNKIVEDAEARQDILAVSVQRGLADWRARVSVKKYEVGGSFSVYLFFGDVPPDSDQWYYDKSFVGTFDVFSNETPETCDNCVDQRDKTITGYIHISRPILTRSDQGSLDKAVVLPQLEQLHWAVKKVATKEVVDLAKIPSLYVTIERTYLAKPVGAKYPQEGKRVLFNRRRDGHYHKV